TWTVCSKFELSHLPTLGLEKGLQYLVCSSVFSLNNNNNKMVPSSRALINGTPSDWHELKEWLPLVIIISI
ncbi:mCG145877, partial [Mus musculus]